jgi:hypothetical protein
MQKIKIFISSAQEEFAKERELLCDYLTKDALFGRFFDTFIFENLPAISRRSDMVYLKEVKNCDIYIGLFGKEYGNEDKNGISPTEHEFNEATKLNKTRFVFITPDALKERHEKEQILIKKIEKDLIRKQFYNAEELKFCVYATLIKYLEEKEIIRTGPFDASVCTGANLKDLDFEKISEFVRIAKSKRGFPLSEYASPDKILTHLNLIDDTKITNAGMLLFGKQPQKFIITSEVKCAQFYGTEIIKPLPASLHPLQPVN